MTPTTPHPLPWPGALPASARSRLETVLAALPEHRRTTFALRVARWWDDLVEGLAPYPDPPEVASRVVELAGTAYLSRSEDLHLLDERRSLEPDWFQRPGMIGYAAYAERFAPAGSGLAGVARRVDHLKDLGVGYLHLMPLLRPRPAPNDGGYAVADYRQVREDLGTMEDLREVAGVLREQGVSLCLDLVLNHVAREHPWAAAARAGDERYRRYFHVFPDRTVPDQYERTLLEVFPDFAPGSFTWDEELGGWVWTTFNSYQWDLAWDNPDVFCELVDVILFLANQGVEVLRLDAIAFLWKRMGTQCQNEPEVHQLTQALRAAARMLAPALVFKAEAIVGPNEVVHYLGQGRHHGKVSDLAYHNSLMVQIWSMLASRETRLATRALGRFPAVPSTTAWITYLRCHDDIGWAIDDADASAVMIEGWRHREFLSQFYSGDFEGSFAEGLVFQQNPATNDARISGSAASLAGLGRALDALDAAFDEQSAAEAATAVDQAVARVLLGYAIVYGWGGIPVLWSGDEVAALNDEGWDAVPEHADDNRWVHRPRLDWDCVVEAHGDPTSPTGRVYAGLRHLAQVRARLPHLHASVPAEVVASPDPGVFAVVRRHPVGPMLALYNVTEQPRQVPGWWASEIGLPLDQAIDALNGYPPNLSADGSVYLSTYQPVWLVRP
ncbi:alpha-amylase family protein [Ornithinimicrobium cerasi]|uniref:Amylosucrase n=1 Tax=Ornithinimicrobium cerasi TaxID=2248773 RepID=A0A285VTX3_9MICO|nr:alpha-amylase family protein [Ornithinimicrobium cerasi]SOC57494.1 amylosucrase [Ornithinimicrobium cerasi]SOC57544.1 amylosucrase [Ornithinimicrobium cerasi]